MKAKTRTGVEKEVPGEVPVLLPEDWVGCLKESTFDAVLGMDGVANFWKDQLQWENSRIKPSKTFFKNLAKDKDRDQVVPFALHPPLHIMLSILHYIGSVDPELGLESNEALTLCLQAW